jgi:hypothetical protein
VWKNLSQNTVGKPVMGSFFAAWTSDYLLQVCLPVCHSITSSLRKAAWQSRCDRGILRPLMGLEAGHGPAVLRPDMGLVG